MVIPEEYRERYDNLARSHPWMREMRDEVERDEAELPEGDAVAILRKWANFWGVSHSTHTQCDSNWEKTTMLALADMIERDYVRRDDYDFMADALKAVCAERDELKGELAIREKMCDELQGQVDRLEKQMRQLEGDLKGARTSRDKWRDVTEKHNRALRKLRKQLKTERELARMWPRFDDGAPVRIGDEFWWDRSAHRVGQIMLYERGFRLENEERTCFTQVYRYGERAERPPLKAADGLPIEEGTLLYGGDGSAWLVESIDRTQKYPIEGSCDGEYKRLKPEWLTHERPDSFELLVASLRGLDPNVAMTKDAVNALADRIERLAKEAG